jgi:hypothetical protein
MFLTLVFAIREFSIDTKVCQLVTFRIRVPLYGPEA